MNKTDLIDAIAAKAGLSKKDSEAALKATIEAIEEALANGEKVGLVGFGTFSVKSKEARKGRNPHTGAEINIPASKTPAFKAGKEFKDIINK